MDQKHDHIAQTADQAGLVSDTVAKVTKDKLITATASIKELTDEEIVEMLKSTKPEGKATTKAAGEIILEVAPGANATFEKLIFDENSAATRMQCPMFALILAVIQLFYCLF